MQINIKRLHKDAVIPSYAKHGDAGMDLTATSKSYDGHGNLVYGTSLAFEIPCGYVGFLYPRSSLSKQTLSLCNHVGVLDSGYRGEVLFKFKPTIKNDASAPEFRFVPYDSEFIEYDVGDRIGQIIIMPIPHIEFNEVGTLENSERGSNGFGSSGQ